jgi:PHD/YefM family antitoxin component YafN of YafNO toxin-antitoxin module
MASLQERFVVNENGERVGVLLGWEEYRRLLEDLEELEAIRACDAAKASAGEVVPFDQATEEMEGDQG